MAEILPPDEEPRSAAVEANIPVVDLLLTTLRGQEEETVIRIPQGAPHFVLLVHNPEPFGDWSAYDIKIVYEGQEIWRRGNWRPDGEGTFNLSFSSNDIPSGQYELTLYGNLPSGGQELLAIKSFTVEYE